MSLSLSVAPQPGQVLQRSGESRTIRFAGVAQPGVAVRLRVLLGKGKAATAVMETQLAVAGGDGRFDAESASVPQGGPYTLEVGTPDEGAAVTIAPVYVGDVWLLAGQSNMEGTARLEHPAPVSPVIRSFTMGRRWEQAREPLHLLMESPDAVHCGAPISPAASARIRRNARHGGGVGLWFAREMLRRTGVPQGLVCTAHGGTSLTQWSPENAPQGGASLYGSMLLSARAAGGRFAGVLWYQGESDTDKAACPLYTERMVAFVQAVRRDLSQPDLPFLMAQIGRCFERGLDPWWNGVQEQQRTLAGLLPKLAVVPTLDLPLDDLIHVSTEGFRVLARRFADAAEHVALGRPEVVPAPELESVTDVLAEPGTPLPSPRAIDLTFKNVVGKLSSGGQEPTGFTSVFEDGAKPNAIFKAELHGNRVRLYLWGSAAGVPLRVVHGYGPAPYVNIRDERGYVLPAFTTDEIPGGGALSPFFTRWRVGPALPDQEAFEAYQPPAPEHYGQWAYREVKDRYMTGFCNLHEEWAGKPGMTPLAATVRVKEPAKLTLRLGYDGPFAAWVDGRKVYADPAGVNPCQADKGIVALDLSPGLHDIVLLQGHNGGCAWGFMVRFGLPGGTGELTLVEPV